MLDYIVWSDSDIFITSIAWFIMRKAVASIASIASLHADLLPDTDSAVFSANVATALSFSTHCYPRQIKTDWCGHPCVCMESHYILPRLFLYSSAVLRCCSKHTHCRVLSNLSALQRVNQFDFEIKMMIYWPHNVVQCGICYDNVCPSVYLLHLWVTPKRFKKWKYNFYRIIDNACSSYLRQNFAILNSLKSVTNYCQNIFRFELPSVRLTRLKTRF